MRKGWIAVAIALALALAVVLFWSSATDSRREPSQSSSEPERGCELGPNRRSPPAPPPKSHRGEEATIEASPDEAPLAYDAEQEPQEELPAEVPVAEVTTTANTKGPPRINLTVSSAATPGQAFYPRANPAGDWVAFFIGMGPTRSLWLAPIDDRGVGSPYRVASSASDYEWTPEGDLLFLAPSNAQRVLWEVRPQGTPKVRPLSIAESLVDIEVQPNTGVLALLSKSTLYLGNSPQPTPLMQFEQVPTRVHLSVGSPQIFVEVERSVIEIRGETVPATVDELGDAVSPSTLPDGTLLGFQPAGPRIGTLSEYTEEGWVPLLDGIRLPSRGGLPLHPRGSGAMFVVSGTQGVVTAWNPSTGSQLDFVVGGVVHDPSIFTRAGSLWLAVIQNGSVAVSRMTAEPTSQSEP